MLHQSIFLTLQVSIVVLAFLWFQSVSRPKFAILAFAIAALVYLPVSWIGRIEKTNRQAQQSRNTAARSMTVKLAPKRPKAEFADKATDEAVLQRTDQAVEAIGHSVMPQRLQIGEVALPTTVISSSLPKVVADLPLLTPTLEKLNFEIPISDLVVTDPAFSFFGINEWSEGPIILVVDFSPSMRGAKLKRLNEEMIASIRDYPEGAEFQIVFYASDFQWLNGSNEYQKRNQKALDDLEKSVTELNLGSGTVDAAPLTAAVRRNPKTIYFHTDGDGEFHRDHSLVDKLIATNHEGGEPCRIHCVEFGDKPDQHPVLKEIAAKSGGEYRFIEVP